VDLIAALSSLKAASEVVKALRTAEKALDEATLKQRLADVTVALADGRIALAEVQEEINTKDKEIATLREALQLAGELVEGPGSYNYLRNDDGGPKGAPICPRCRAEGRIMQTVQFQLANKAQCPLCQTIFHPVSIFLPSGITAQEERQRRQQEMIERSQHASRSGRNSWMGR